MEAHIDADATVPLLSRVIIDRIRVFPPVILGTGGRVCQSRGDGKSIFYKHLWRLI
jgi:hypothetical protein